MSGHAFEPEVRWQWFKASEYGGLDGGAMSKLFRNNAGTLADVALLAREAVQNSWDAARRMRQEDGDDVPFKVAFRFVELWGAERDAMVDALDLKGLRARRDDVGAELLVGESILDQLDDPEAPLRLLYIEDMGTHGLFGSPTLIQQSHLYLAMYSLGSSNKDPSAGGSYGFGKSALQRVSRINTVIAHSAFREHPEIGDLETTRLVGFTWWPGHRVADQSYEGRAIFAPLSGGEEFKPAPLRGDGATIGAERLRFRPRDGNRAEDRGSSFLIVDSVVSPDDLLDELEKWWWPALEENLFEVEVIEPDGHTRVPRPRDNAFVKQFLQAYRIATGLDEPKDPNRERRPSDLWRRRGDVTESIGDLGLTVPDEPLTVEGDETSGEGIVALMRAPRMVIRYEPHTARRIPIRGVFIASSEANDLLRLTEPASHDLWSTKTSSDIPGKATAMASKLQRSIRNDVKNMADEVAPPPPKERQSLRLFAQLLGGLLGSARGPAGPVPPGGEPIELRLQSGPSPEVVEAGRLRLRAEFSVKLAEGAPSDTCEVAVACGLHILEDERAGATWPVTLTLRRGDDFVFDDGKWRGDISKDRAVVFEVLSDPYSHEWTVQLQPTVTRLDEWSA